MADARNAVFFGRREKKTRLRFGEDLAGNRKGVIGEARGGGGG